MQQVLGHSVAEDVFEAAEEVCRAFPEKPQLVLFFSDGDRFDAFSEELHRRYPFSTVTGASTFASFSSAGLYRHGLNAAALSGGISVSAGLIREITREPGLIYRDVVREALSKLPASRKPHDGCCLLFNPAGTAGEESVLDILDEALSDSGLPVFGGSASSEVCAHGAVSLNGSAYANSSVFVLLRLECGHFNITQENIFSPADKTFQVTRANTARRTLYELDGQPAADLLCDYLGITLEKLPAALAEYPFGRIQDGKLFINEVERVNADGSVTAYCRFFKNSTVSLLRVRDFRSTMAETFSEVRDKTGCPKFTIAVNCYSRTQMYLKNGWMDDFTNAMAKELGCYIGLTSHGEQLGKYQLNLTLLLLSFAEDDAAS